MNIQYYADDGTIKNLGDDELQHYKYIKKIKTGSGWRYFYTPEELKAYYEGSKAAYKLGNTVLDKRGDYQTKKKINSLERKKNATQEQKAWKAYEESKLRGNSDKKAYRDAVKSVVKDEAKFQLERKKLETKNDLDKKKRAARSEAKALTGTAKLAGKGAKDAADSVPRLKKQSDNRYYIADNKTQKKIAKNLSKIREDNNKIGDIHRSPRKPADAISTANRAAKLSARTGASDTYRKKYEVKNVTNRKLSEIKNKTSKGKSVVEKRLKKTKKTVKNEAKGVKRASNAIRGKGNNFYDAHDTNPKSYSTYNKKKKNFSKNKKTGKIERGMIGAYRRIHPNE